LHHRRTYALDRPWPDVSAKPKRPNLILAANNPVVADAFLGTSVHVTPVSRVEHITVAERKGSDDDPRFGLQFNDDWTKYTDAVQLSTKTLIDRLSDDPFQ
jgi:hypothetical protein